MQDGPDSAPSGGSPPGADADQRLRDLRDLRALLVGDEQNAIADIRRRIEALDLTAEDVAKLLPEAIALRSGRDGQMARALGPTLERAFGESVQRNPQQIADAIYPTLGPAIRKAISEAIGGLVAGLNRAMQLSLSPQGLRWRFEAWRMGIPFGQLVLQRTLVFRVEQVYLIHAETGLLLAHVAAPDLAEPDADVISGMLTAIRDFVGDSFESGASGGLRAFTVGDVTMLVEPGPRAIIAATVRGPAPPELLTRLQSTLELLHLRFAAALTRFDGDNAPFEPAKPLLAECLETVLQPEGRGRIGAVPRVAWGLAIATTVVLLVLGGRSRLNWNRARALVESEPGWVTLDAERNLRTWRFRGLKDPDARAPSEVLSASGIDTRRVRESWTQYLSSDSAVVLARALRVLSPPASVSLSLVADTLHISGVATTSWFDAVGSAQVAGASLLARDRLQFALGAEHRDVTDRMVGARILFSVGSAELSGVSLRALDTLAQDWRAAQDAAGFSWLVVVTATGRTDTTGSSEMNRRLSDDRARVVARYLIARGVEPAAIQPRGIGTSAPLEAGDLEERARINRSVAFALELTPRGGRR